MLVANFEGDVVEGWVREEVGRDAAAMVEDMGVDVNTNTNTKTKTGKHF